MGIDRVALIGTSVISLMLLPYETKQPPSLSSLDREANADHGILEPLNRQAQLSIAALFKVPLFTFTAW